MKKEERITRDILANIGGKENVQRIAHCMTRLRLTVKDDGKTNISDLKKVDGVMGVIKDDTLQIVIGPGTVNKVAAEMGHIVGLAIGEEAEVEEENLTFVEKAGINQANIKEKNKTPFKMILSRIGNIYIPLIPGLVAYGLINVGVSFVQNTGLDH